MSGVGQAALDSLAELFEASYLTSTSPSFFVSEWDQFTDLGMVRTADYPTKAHHLFARGKS